VTSSTNLFAAFCESPGSSLGYVFFALIVIFCFADSESSSSLTSATFATSLILSVSAASVFVSFL